MLVALSMAVGIGGLLALAVLRPPVPFVIGVLASRYGKGGDTHEPLRTWGRLWRARGLVKSASRLHLLLANALRG